MYLIRTIWALLWVFDLNHLGIIVGI